MKYLIPLLLLTNACFSQSIKGTLLDSLNLPVPFATIALLNAADSSIVTGSISNESGNFTIKSNRPGNFLLKITTVGFTHPYTDIIILDSLSNVDVGNITLYSDGVNLTEISVSAIKPLIEFKNGNIIVNVEDSPLAKGNTVYDLLSKLPGVSIENNIIQLNGRPGVVIMLDGRVQQLTNVQLINILKSMSAELVEKIELLKNPPVQYDAAGTSGMINIKTKKAKRVGISGSAYTESSQGFYARSMSGLALNFRSSKIALFSNLDYNYGNYQDKETFHKRFTTDSSLTEFTSHNTIKDLDKSLNYRFGADWFINKKNIIGFKVDGGPGSYISNNHGTNTITGYNDNGFDHLNASVYIPDTWNVNNYNINAEHAFDTIGTKLSFSTDYTILSEKYLSNIENKFFDKDNIEATPSITYRSANLGSSTIIASKLDLTKTINAESSFESGVKISGINTTNNFVFERKNNSTGNYYSDTALTNNYTYVEKTYAVYFNYIRSFKNASMQLGLRAENTNLVGRNTEKNFELKRSYYNLFPNVSLEYTPSANHTFQLNLNRRIDRPDYNNLNPFRSYRDQYSYFQGSPFLQPHYSSNFEFTHSYKHFISNSFSYSRIDRVMLDYTIQNDTTKVTFETIKNMKVNNYYAYSLFLQHSIKPWWEISLNSTFSYIQYVGDVSGAIFKTASFYYDPSLTNTFAVSKNTKLEVIAFYHSAKNNGLVQVRQRWMLSLAIKKTFFKDKLDCSIGVNDVFYSAYFRSDVKFNNQNWNFIVTKDSRRLVLSINYNFGRLKITERDTNSDEQEKNRLNH